MKNKKKGFTLVELLAVIVILAVILVIAVPQIMNIINDSKKGTLKSTALLIAKTAEKAKVQNEVLGNTKPIKCKDIVKLNEDDYSVCNVKFDENDNAVVMLKGKKDGKFNRMMCTGTSSNMECKELEQGLNCTFDGEAVNGATYVNGQYTYTYDLQYSGGWKVELTDKNSTDPVTTKVCSYINGKPIVSTVGMFMGSKATSIDLSGFDSSNVINMMLMFMDVSATSLDLSELDTGNVSSMNGMFFNSSATSIDLSGFYTNKLTDSSMMFGNSKAIFINLSSFDTSNVTNMSNMFNGSAVTSLDLSGFDTSNVTNMAAMFAQSKIEEINGLNNFDTSNVTNMLAMFSGIALTSIDLSNFDTSNVANMSDMFSGTKIEELDLSSFDTSNVTNVARMFRNATATKGYARTQADADKFNASSDKPEGLVFTVKGATN